MSERTAFVLGAGGAVGEAIVHALIAQGWGVHASMRTPRADVRQRLSEAGAVVASHDIGDANAWAPLAAQCDALICATHLELTAAALSRVERIGRLVVFSSNNVAADAESATYRALAAAEQTIMARCPSAAVIRPTLIYGDPRLETVTRLLRMSASWPVVPMPGSGRARMQPVFHEDLGRLAAGLADSDVSGIFAAGGPDVTTMRDLYEMAKRATGSRALVLPVGGPLLSLAARVGLYKAEQVARVDSDRSVVAQAALPDDLVPRTTLADGLARHWQAIKARASAG